MNETHKNIRLHPFNQTNKAVHKVYNVNSARNKIFAKLTQRKMVCARGTFK